jgi:hypothetical protein
MGRAWPRPASLRHEPQVKREKVDLAYVTKPTLTISQWQG